MCALLCAWVGAQALAQSAVMRPDPTDDPLVSTQINAQASLNTQVTDAQISNLSSHLRGLNNGFKPCSDAGRIDLTAAPRKSPELRAADATGEAAADPFADQAVGANSPAGATALQRARPTTACLNDALFHSHRSGFWSGGSLSYGAGAAGGYINTTGITLGLDHELFEHLVIGAAIGSGWYNSMLDQAGSQTGISSTNGSLYLAYHPLEQVSFDALVGYDNASLSNRRWIHRDQSWAQGTRAGSSWFGSVSLSSSIDLLGYRLRPYVRSEFVSSSLSAYSENSPSDLALSYQTISDSSSQLSAGAVGQYDFSFAGDTLTPTIAVSYERTLSDVPSSSLFYADGGIGDVYSFAVAPIMPSQVILTRRFGLRFHSHFGFDSDIAAVYPSSSLNLTMAPLYSASIHMQF